MQFYLCSLILWVRNLHRATLRWEDPLEKETATHSSILAWRIPQTEEPGGPQSMGLQRDTTERLNNNNNIAGMARLCLWHLGPQLEGLATERGDPVAQGWNHGVLLFTCLRIDTGCWLGPQLGYRPEHQHEASPCGLLSFLTIWQLIPRISHSRE